MPGESRHFLELRVRSLRPLSFMLVGFCVVFDDGIREETLPCLVDELHTDRLGCHHPLLFQLGIERELPILTGVLPDALPSPRIPKEIDSLRVVFSVANRRTRTRA